jgi:signal transduction histidine kinase/putative methionine-R-sulfoxide reductase with GAF domain
MTGDRFEQADGLRLLGEVVRLTSEPAAPEAIGSDVLSLMARTLGSEGAVLVISDGAVDRVAAAYGDSGELQDEVRRARLPLSEAEAQDASPAGDGDRVVIPLVSNGTRLGAVVLRRPPGWNPIARSFAHDAARALAGSLGAARMLDDLRRQGERLERRNVELEILRDLTRRLRDEPDDQGMLQRALDLILEKLGLQSGWIFWDVEARGRLALAASRGVAEEFHRQARESGIGECLCRDVYATGQRMQARNTLDCPRLPHLVSGLGTMSHACVPLTFERGILGVLNIASQPGRVFTADELQFLETVGRHVCLAVDRAQAARAEARRNAEARALVSLARAMGGSLHLDTVLSAAGNYARELLGVERCAIFLGGSAEGLRFAFLTGEPMEGLSVGGPVDFRALGSKAPLEALRQRRTLVIRDAGDDPYCAAALARRWSIGSAILVPLVGHDTLEGLLIATRPRAGDWRPEELDLADALAGQVALAIENARLFEQAQTTLLRLQEAQYAMMRAERLAAAGTLASSLAHEIRNPLNAISLQLVLLARRLSRVDEPLREELSGLVESSRHEIVRLDQLVEEFLQLSSIDRVRLEPGYPEDVAREVMTLMGPVARERGITVRDALSGVLPPVPLDREKIKQALMNLVRNAMEAMPDGGTLTLMSDTVDGAPVIRVSDTGIGIDPGLDVFDFFITTKREGSGLGLPIARRIVEAHGGSLTYESHKGKGTVFSVSFKPQAPGKKRHDMREETSHER